MDGGNRRLDGQLMMRCRPCTRCLRRMDPSHIVPLLGGGPNTTQCAPDFHGDPLFDFDVLDRSGMWWKAEWGHLIVKIFVFLAKVLNRWLDQQFVQMRQTVQKSHWKRLLQASHCSGIRQHQICVLRGELCFIVMPHRRREHGGLHAGHSFQYSALCSFPSCVTYMVMKIMVTGPLQVTSQCLHPVLSMYSEKWIRRRLLTFTLSCFVSVYQSISGMEMEMKDMTKEWTQDALVVVR